MSKTANQVAKEVKERTQINELRELCLPIAKFLKENYDPYHTVVITDSHIRLTNDKIGIPVK